MKTFARLYIFWFIVGTLLVGATIMTCNAFRGGSYTIDDYGPDHNSY